MGALRLICVNKGGKHMSMEDLDLVGSVGRQLRSARLARGSSVSQLAQASGVSVSAIRKVEAGASSPSFQTIIKLTNQLGLVIDEVLARAQASDGQVQVIRAVPRNDKAISELAFGDLDDALLSGRVIELPAHGHRLYPLGPESGSSFAYVLEGSVALVFDDDSTENLSGADAYHMVDQPPRVVRNASGKPARVLFVKDDQSRQTLMNADLA